MENDFQIKEINEKESVTFQNDYKLFIESLFQ